MAFIRSLRVVLLLGIAGLVVGILLSLSANARGGAPPPGAEAVDNEPPGAASLAQESANVEIVRTRRGTPTLRLEADGSRSYTDGRLELTHALFRLFDREGRETAIESPFARSLAAADAPPAEAGAGPRLTPSAGEGLGSWLLEGGVVVREAGGLTLAMPKLAYIESDGQATTGDRVSFTRGPAAGSATGMVYQVEPRIVTFRQDVVAAMPMGGMGQVNVKARSASHDLAARSFVMDGYRAETARGEVLSGSTLVATFLEAGGIQRLEADEGFVLESAHATPVQGPPSPLSKLLALEGTRTMRGRRLAVLFGADAEPSSIEVSGDAILTAVDRARGEAPSSIAARTLTFDLIGGNLTRARAEGAVDLKGAPAEGEAAGFRLTSDNLDAVFDPNLGMLLNVEGQGAIQLTDRGMKSQGSRTILDPDTDIVTIAGEEGKPASASWQDRRIQAQRIEVDRRRKTLSARGGVRASYMPPEDSTGSRSATGAGQPLPFFREGETIYAMSGTLQFAEQGKVAAYRDRVRLWQGESRLEAAEIDVNETAGTLEARGEVTSAFRQIAPEGRAVSPNPSDQIVTVAASTMKYDRGANRILYGGKIVVTQGALRVTADSLTVTLAADGSGAEKMEAAGDVALRDPGRTGKGDRLIADPKADTLKLIGSGREATVQDESGQQVVRGSSLTMDRSGDRILVESEVGGRTWITLKPRQKGAPGVGSVPRD